MKLLLTGRGGQVGSALERSLAPLGELVALAHADLDLTNTAAIRARILDERPDVVINAAAYTAVDRAEKERAAAFAVNAIAVEALAAAAKQVDALLVHYSTDYVFDGEKAAPYVETDATAPINVYGESKLAGELAIAASGCRHYVFRTCWVYAAQGKNFLRSILVAAATNPELRVVNDQHGAPTSSGAIAEATAKALAKPSPSGIYHLSAAGGTTWHGFASEILARRGIRTPVLPVSSSEFPAVARRPRNSMLSNDKFVATFGHGLADWRVQLDAIMSAMQ